MANQSQRQTLQKHVYNQQFDDHINIGYTLKQIKSFILTNKSPSLTGVKIFIWLIAIKLFAA